MGIETSFRTPISELLRYRSQTSDIGTDIRANSDIGTKSDIVMTSDIVVKISEIGSDIVEKTPISGTRYRIPGSCHLLYRVFKAYPALATYDVRDVPDVIADIRADIGDNIRIYGYRS